ncbi:MAG: hypothetical protein OSB41_14255, partial [Kiritimatiellae bacterium]|nr:hypothetical protein [Kiritimatiellia bacterium]
MTVPRTSSKTWIGRYLKQKDLVLMTLPVLLFFAIFHYLPMTGLIIAFKDYILSEGVLQSRWIGLENFRQLFGSDEFPQALRNTFIISFLRLLFGFFAPVVRVGREITARPCDAFYIGRTVSGVKHQRLLQSVCARRDGDHDTLGLAFGIFGQLLNGLQDKRLGPVQRGHRP